MKASDMHRPYTADWVASCVVAEVGTTSMCTYVMYMNRMTWQGWPDLLLSRSDHQHATSSEYVMHMMMGPGTIGAGMK